MNDIARFAQPMAGGMVLAGGTYATASLLPEDVQLPLHAVLLSAIAAVYVGFAIADGRARFLAIQGAGVLAFGALAVAGLALHAGFLAAGYGLHGVWDLLHHRSEVPGRQAPWYVPLCLAYDWVVAAYLLALY